MSNDFKLIPYGICNFKQGNYSANARPIPLSDGYLNYEPCLNAYQSAK